MTPARFLDPLLMTLVALGVGLFLGFRGAVLTRTARWARALAWSAWGVLWALSTPLVANGITARTEMEGPELGPALAGTAPEQRALVILAGGLNTLLETVPPRERLDGGTTHRVLGAARLYHQHGFGVVVLSAGTRPEADGMVDLLTALGVPAERLVREERSRNTRENALFAAEILAQRHVSTVVLATSATHLRRSVRLFERAGVKVIPAPVDVVGSSPLEIDALLPSAHALSRTAISLHEILGLLRA